MKARFALAALMMVATASMAHADSRTSCQKNFLDQINCTTTSDDYDNRALEDGVNSLREAIAARAARRRDKAEVAAPKTIPRPMNFATGNGYLDGCLPLPANDIEAGMCYGFIDGYLAREFALGQSPICIPNDVTRGQLVAVVTRFIESNPDRRHYGSGVLTFAALSTAFPCPKAPEASAPGK